jgi:hypothetical protein
MINNLIENIKNICNVNLDSFYLYNTIKKELDNIDSNLLLDSLQKYKEYINIKEIKNSDVSYIKHTIYSTDAFDIIYIKWNENSFTKIHDHPDKCCLLKLLSGRLIEESYERHMYYNNEHIQIHQINTLYPDDVCFRKSNRILHKIISQIESHTIHIYVPGNYTPKNY